jgi:membrane protease YdiL (CAAX protease family)
VYAAVLLIGVLLSYALHPVSTIAVRIVAVLIFVGFLEEFFFRGYLQSRLNRDFGRPFRFRNVDFGVGLLLSATIFGLSHPLSVADSTPWPWALWTAAVGLAFGFVREKTGSVVPSALLHGAMLLPTVFFAPV